MWIEAVSGGCSLGPSRPCRRTSGVCYSRGFWFVSHKRNLVHYDRSVNWINSVNSAVKGVMGGCFRTAQLIQLSYKRAGPVHFSLKHRMSLGTTVVRAVAKDYEFKLPPCLRWTILISHCLTVSAIISVFWSMAGSRGSQFKPLYFIPTVMHCFYFLDSWCQGRAFNGPLGLLDGFQLTHPFEDATFSIDSRRPLDLGLTCWKNQDKILWFLQCWF